MTVPLPVLEGVALQDVVTLLDTVGVELMLGDLLPEGVEVELPVTLAVLLVLGVTLPLTVVLAV